MKKRNIAICSVLKPLRDSRGFYKLAISLRETNKYRINIIGFLEKNTPKEENIEFTEIFSQHRLHPSRLLAPWKVLQQWRKFKPELIIISTWELLIIARIYKRFQPCKIIYDVQENYSLNIKYNKSLPSPLRKLAQWWVQSVEKFSKPSIDHYLLAEACYLEELAHFRPATLIENKYNGVIKPGERKKLRQENLHFLISGTLSPAYGTTDAIRWFVDLVKDYPQAKLSIIGHSPLASYSLEMEELCRGQSQITSHISPFPVPKASIEQAILRANVLLLPYHIYPSIAAKIPTKLYEALANNKPVVLSKNPVWESIIDAYPAGIAVDFSSKNTHKASIEKLLSTRFFDHPVGSEVSWDSEGKKLISLVEKLLSNR